MTTPLWDSLFEADREKLERAADWRTVTKDSVTGLVVGTQDRDVPGRVYEIPDPRVAMLAGLIDDPPTKDVVEYGCLEGAHTIALARTFKSVYAIDSRSHNIIRSLLRCAVHGISNVTFGRQNVDNPVFLPPLGHAVFHVGVLYHLADPVSHLVGLIDNAPPLALLLDTHYTKDPKETYKSQVSRWLPFPCEIKSETPDHPRSGMTAVSRWLCKESILSILHMRFSFVEIVDDRMERNGPRMTVICRA